MVDAAEFDYQRTRDTYAELVAAVRGMLADGFTDFEAVADVWRTLRTQEERRQHFLLAAIAVVQIAKSPQPPPPLGEPGNTPN